MCKTRLVNKIILKNVRIYAYHGCLKEENAIGSDYLINLTVWTDLAISAQSDALSDTVDYVHLNNIVKEEMQIPSKLLEKVAARISNRIFIELQTVDKAKVSVAKVNPPIGGDVQEVSVVLKRKRH